MKTSLSGRTLIVIAFIFVFAAVLFLNNYSLFFSVSEIKMLGFKMKLRDIVSPPLKSKNIALITIDQKSKDLIGRWPWGRDKYVRFIERLTKKEKNLSDPCVIAFDILFTDEDRLNDCKLAETLKKSRSVVLAGGYDPEKTTPGKIIFKPLSDIIRQANPAVGSIIINSAPEEKVISIPILTKGEYKGEKGTQVCMYSFEIMILKTFLGSTTDTLKKDGFQTGNIKIPFNRAYFHLKGSIKEKLIDSFIISYRGNPGGVFDHYSFSDVYTGRIPIEKLAKRILIVINTFDPNDMRKTTTGNLIFGGEMHAYALKTILEKDFIYETAPSVNFAIFLILTLLTVFVLLKTENRIIASLHVVLIIIFYLVVNFSAFIFFSLWIPVMLPVTGIILFTAGFIIIEHYTIKKTLHSLLPSSFIKNLHTVSSEPKAGGKVRCVTVLFADIRGYTNLSESMTSIEVMNMLNEYHQLVKKPIHENGGEIFDFQGDAYMVVFGSDEKHFDHAERAVRAAITIENLVLELRKKWEEQGKHQFTIGIGIATGDVALGYVGHDKKLQPAAIGDTTNVAARLQGKSAELNAAILMTESTFLEARNRISLKYIKEVELKGKSEPLKVYGVDEKGYGK